MRTRKLYNLLSRISPVERKNFAEFLRSPLHAHRPKLAQLVELMEELLFQDPDQPLSNEDFYAAYYPGKAYDSNNLNRLISTITTELKQYLGLLCYQRDRAAQLANTVREYSRRHWNDLIPGEVEFTRKVMDAEIPEDEHKYYQQLRIEQLAILPEGSISKTKKASYLQRCIDLSDTLYLILKLRYDVISMSFELRSSSVHLRRGDILHSTHSYQDLISSKTILGLYSKMAPLASPGFDKETFLRLSNEVLPNLPSYFDDSKGDSIAMSKDDAEALNDLLSNYLSRSSSDRLFLREQMIKLSTVSIFKGLSFQNGELDPHLLMNHLKMLCASERVEEAKETAASLLDKIPPKTQAFLNQHITGFFQFLEGNNKGAISSLVQAKALMTASTRLTQDLDTRVLLSVCWYRFDEVDQMSYELSALRNLIARSKFFAKTALSTYRRFLRIMLSIERAERRSADVRLRRLAIIENRLTLDTSFTMMLHIKKELRKRLQLPEFYF